MRFPENKLTFLLPFVVVVAALISCHKKTSDQSAHTTELPASFTTFYDRFLTDSAYQMQHITFPLAGLPSNVDSLNDVSNFHWIPESWILHRKFDNSDGAYVHSLRLVAGVIIETVRIKNTAFQMERRFAELDEWHLIYYAEIREVR